MWDFNFFFKKDTSCIRHPRFANLSVVPYIRGRLVFAELVARVMEEKYDVVVVDLPSFMNENRWLDLPLRLFPVVSSLIIKKGDSHCTLLPFVPNDADSISASLARMKGIALECVDDANLINYPEGSLFYPEMLLKDDYFVFAEGLEGYFTPLFDRMDALWRRASYMEKAFTSYRTSVVAARLKRHLPHSGKVLFVCEYRLWWAVRRCLEEPTEDPVFPPSPLQYQDRDAAFVIEDPYLFWAKGLLDDYPLITLRFCRSLQQRNILSFDKLDALSKVLADITTPEALVRAGSPSMRLLMIFQRYLKTRMTLHQRVTPLPTIHLFEGARSCVGTDFARTVAARLLRYPLPAISKAEGIPAVFVTIKDNLIVMGGKLFDLPDVFHATPYQGGPVYAADQFSPGYEEGGRKWWAAHVHPYITRQETREMGNRGEGIRWAVEADYRVHELGCSQLRDIIRKRMYKVRVTRSWGTLGDGIHWKATIAARARGEEAIYIQQRLRKKLGNGRFNEYTPIVFLLSDNIDESSPNTIYDGNLAQRNRNLGNTGFPYERHPAPDRVFTIFFTSEKRPEYLWGAHVQKERLTSLAFLYTRSVMGLDRYAAIKKRPERLQCRVEPMGDVELKDFPLSEIGVAWAVKYAESVVIVAAYAGWQSSARLLRFAQRRHVKIITCPLSTLAPGMIKRLQRLYFISTPLKKHPEREKIAKRFLY